MSLPSPPTVMPNDPTLAALQADPHVVWDEASELWICTACEYSLPHTKRADMRKHVARKKHLESVKMLEEGNGRTEEMGSSPDREGAVLDTQGEIHLPKTSQAETQKVTDDAESKNEDNSGKEKEENDDDGEKYREESEDCDIGCDKEGKENGGVHKEEEEDQDEKSSRSQSRLEETIMHLQEEPYHFRRQQRQEQHRDSETGEPSTALCEICQKSVYDNDGKDVILCDGKEMYGETWCKAKIMGVYEDGTYYIEYLQDGSVETFVPSSYIRSLDEVEQEINPGSPKKSKNSTPKMPLLRSTSADESFIPDENVDFKYNFHEIVMSKYRKCTNEVHLFCLRYPEHKKIFDEDFYCPSCIPPAEARSNGAVCAASSHRLMSYLNKHDKARDELSALHNLLHSNEELVKEEEGKKLSNDIDVHMTSNTNEIKSEIGQNKVENNDDSERVGTHVTRTYIGEVECYDVYLDWLMTLARHWKFENWLQPTREILKTPIPYSDFDPTDQNLVGQPVMLFIPPTRYVHYEKDEVRNPNEKHIGRITARRFIDKGLRKGTYEYLVHFKSSGQDREIGVIHWMGLEEHACCVGYGLSMIDVGNGFQWPIRTWKRSRVEIACGNVQVRGGVHVILPDDSKDEKNVQLQFKPDVTIKEFFFLPPDHELVDFFCLDAMYIEKTTKTTPLSLEVTEQILNDTELQTAMGSAQSEMEIVDNVCRLNALFTPEEIENRLHSVDGWTLASKNYVSKDDNGIQPDDTVDVNMLPLIAGDKGHAIKFRSDPLSQSRYINLFSKKHPYSESGSFLGLDAPYLVHELGVDYDLKSANTLEFLYHNRSTRGNGFSDRLIFYADDPKTDEVIPAVELRPYSFYEDIRNCVRLKNPDYVESKCPSPLNCYDSDNAIESPRKYCGGDEIDVDPDKLTYNGMIVKEMKPSQIRELSYLELRSIVKSLGGLTSVNPKKGTLLRSLDKFLRGEDLKMQKNPVDNITNEIKNGKVHDGDDDDGKSVSEGGDHDDQQYDDPSPLSSPFAARRETRVSQLVDPRPKLTDFAWNEWEGKVAVHRGKSAVAQIQKVSSSRVRNVDVSYKDGSKDQWNVHVDDIRVLEKGSEDYMIYWSLEVNECSPPKIKTVNKKKSQNSKFSEQRRYSEIHEDVDAKSRESESDEEIEEEANVQKERNTSKETEDDTEMASHDEVLDDLVSFMRASDFNDEEKEEDRSVLFQEIERVFKARSDSRFLSDMREFITYFSLEMTSQPSSFPTLMEVPSLTKAKAIACIFDLVLQKISEEKAAEKMKIELQLKKQTRSKLQSPAGKRILDSLENFNSDDEFRELLVELTAKDLAAIATYHYSRNPNLTYPGRRGLPVYDAYDVSVKNDVFRMRKEKLIGLLQDVLHIERVALKEKMAQTSLEMETIENVGEHEKRTDENALEENKEESREEMEEEEEEEIDILDAVMCKNMSIEARRLVTQLSAYQSEMEIEHSLKILINQEKKVATKELREIAEHYQLNYPEMMFQNNSVFVTRNGDPINSKKIIYTLTLNQLKDVVFDVFRSRWSQTKAGKLAYANGDNESNDEGNLNLPVQAGVEEFHFEPFDANALSLSDDLFDVPLENNIASTARTSTGYPQELKDRQNTESKSKPKNSNVVGPGDTSEFHVAALEASKESRKRKMTRQALKELEAQNNEKQAVDNKGSDIEDEVQESDDSLEEEDDEESVEDSLPTGTAKPKRKAAVDAVQRSNSKSQVRSKVRGQNLTQVKPNSVNGYSDSTMPRRLMRKDQGGQASRLYKDENDDDDSEDLEEIDEEDVKRSSLKELSSTSSIVSGGKRVINGTDSDDSDDNYNPKKRPNKAMKKTVIKMASTQLKGSTAVEDGGIKIGKKKPLSIPTRTKPLAPMQMSSSADDTHESGENVAHIQKDNDSRRHLFVDGIPENCPEHRVRKLFSKYGITDLRLKPRRPGMPFYAFVSFSTTEQANAAMKEMHRFEIERGYKINVHIRLNDDIDRLDRGRDRERDRDRDRERSRDIAKERERPRDRDRDWEKERDRDNPQDRGTANTTNRERVRDDRSRDRGFNNADSGPHRGSFDSRASGGSRNNSTSNPPLNAGDEKRLEEIAEQKVKELFEQKLREKEQKELETLREQMRRKDEIILKEKEARDKILKENEDMKRFIATKNRHVINSGVTSSAAVAEICRKHRENPGSCTDDYCNYEHPPIVQRHSVYAKPGRQVTHIVAEPSPRSFIRQPHFLPSSSTQFPSPSTVAVRAVRVVLSGREMEQKFMARDNFKKVVFPAVQWPFYSQAFIHFTDNDSALAFTRKYNGLKQTANNDSRWNLSIAEPHHDPHDIYYRQVREWIEETGIPDRKSDRRVVNVNSMPQHLADKLQIPSYKTLQDVLAQIPSIHVFRAEKKDFYATCHFGTAISNHSDEGDVCRICRSGKAGNGKSHFTLFRFCLLHNKKYSNRMKESHMFVGPPSKS